MSELNDLLNRFLQKGDAGAMEEIVRQTRPRLLATARRIGNPQDAEDSVQATYHALLRRGDKPLDAPLIAWLLTVVVRIAFRRKAIEARESQLAEQLALPSDEVGPRRATEILERNSNLREEVGRLAPHYRDALILRYLEGLSVRECARLLEAPDETVRTRLKRARRLLRGRLHPRVAGLLLFVPWWLADSARASSLGVAMKSKVALVGVLIAVAGLLFVARDLFRQDGTAEIARTDVDRRTAADSPVEEPVEDGIRERPKAEQPELPAPVELDAVDRERDVHGTVVTAEGAPIAGARLQLVQFPWRRGGVLHYDALRRTEAGPETRSARDGTFRIPWQRARMGWLRVSAAGYAERQIAMVQAGERLTIELNAGATIAIRARASDGAPVEGARVRFFRNPRRAAVAGYSREHLGVTDAGGRCELSGVGGPSEGWVVLEHPERGSTGWHTVQVPEAGKRIELEIEYPASRTIRGRIIDAATRLPIAGARIGMNWVQNCAVRSGDDGRYVLPGWTGEGVSDIHVSHPDYGREAKDVGALETIDFQMEAGDRVTGRVVDDRGVPVPKARIAAIGSFHDGERQKMSRAYGLSAIDGSFVVTGLRHDMGHALVVMKPGFGRVLFDFDPARVAGAEVELGTIELRRGLSIEGRIVDNAGAPLARVPIELTGANADRDRFRPRTTNPNRSYGEEESRLSDDLGRFRFPDLSPGSYKLVVRPEGGLRMERKVVIADQGVRDILFSPAVTRSITVRVLSPEGKPVPNASVSSRCDGKPLGGRTDGRGELVLSASGSVTRLGVSYVWAATGEAPYRMPPSIDRVADDRTEVEFVLRPGATITGVVRKPDGAPLPRSQVDACVDGKRVSAALCDEAGHFRLVVDPGTSVDLEFAGVSRGRRGRAFDWQGSLRGVAAGATGQVLQLAPIEKKSLTVLVLDPDGKPIVGYPVYCHPAMVRRMSARTDEQGRAVFEALPKRKCSVMILGSNPPIRDLSPPRSVDAVPDGQVITMRFRHGLIRTGRVSVATQAHVIFYREVDGKREFVASIVSGTDGGFRAVLPPDRGTGPFIVLAQARGEDGMLSGEVSGIHIDGPEPVIELRAATK